DAGQARRTVYTKVYRNTRDSLLDVFDAPEGFTSTAERNVTTTPTQALLMFNSASLAQRARSLATRLQRAHADDAARIDTAFRLLYARSPAPGERSAALQFLQNQAGRIAPAAPTVSAGFQSEKMPYREGRAAVMHPQSGQARFQVPDSPTLPAGDFTVEGFVLL